MTSREQTLGLGPIAGTEATAGPVVSVRGLTIALTGSGRVIADGVDLTIAAGEILGLVGESGSGKTSVGSALLGYVRKGAEITSGTITVAGADTLSLTSSALEAYRGGVIGYMPQDPATALNPALRIGRQLAEVLEVHAPGIASRELAERVAEALADVELPTDAAFGRRYPHQISGGQQQRVCLAMAFLLRPAAIMLDEPTTGLDVTTQARVLDVVRSLCATHRTAALYITHDLTVVSELAQRVAVLRRGQIVEVGSAADVLRHPQHPYTQALVAAVPDIADHPVREPMPTPAGATPAPDAGHPGGGPTGDAGPPGENPAGAAGLAARLAAIDPGEDIVTVDDLRCSYGAARIVKGISLAIRSGECLALVGESGSGKSTISLTLIGLVQPTGGSVRLAGVPLAPRARDRSTQARSAVQYIFQNPYASLNPRHTIGRILTKAHRHFFGGSRRQARVAADRILERVGLSATMVRQYPEQLSGGERQRVAIARALLSNPRVLVCDEVTSALDVSVQAQILDLLADLKRQQGLSLLFVTHNLAVVRYIADRVAVLESGLIVEVGDTDGVLDAPQHPYTRQLLADTPSWHGVRT